MKKKTSIAIGLAVAFLIGYGAFEMQSDLTADRGLASAPEKYEELSGCEKQDHLWKRIEESTHKELPPYSKFGIVQLLKMSFQELKVKGDLHSDYAPQGWRKYLHRRGAVAKVKLVGLTENFSGIFAGADCGLLRLSLTYLPKGKRPVAPGLALKFLRNQTTSANVSALVSLDGQEDDYNFFKHPMSNIVPASDAFGAKLVHRVFSKVSSYPEELVLEDFGLLDAKGEKVSSPRFPRQVFFVPGPELNFDSAPHEIRDDLLRIPEGTVIYQVYAVPETHTNFDYSEYTPEMAESFRNESVHIADIVNTSEFKASQFGDEGIFFRHQIRPLKDGKY